MVQRLRDQRGRRHGGLGTVCDLVYVGEGPAFLNTAGNRIVLPPFGLFGGDDGLAHHYKIVHKGGDRVLGSKDIGVLVNPGDHIVCLSSGGGGYGQPQNRVESAAKWDIKNGYTTG